MVQGCGGSSLELKSTQTVGLTRITCWQDFDGDFTLQRQIAGTIHLAHSARSEERDDLIGIEPGSCCQWHMFTRLYRRDTERISAERAALGEARDSLTRNRAQGPPSPFRPNFRLADYAPTTPLTLPAKPVSDIVSCAVDKRLQLGYFAVQS